MTMELSETKEQSESKLLIWRRYLTALLSEYWSLSKQETKEMRKEFQMGDQTHPMLTFSARYSTIYGFSLWSLRMHMNKGIEFGMACRCG